MDKLIQDVLHYSRTARGELKLTAVDATALLRGIIESYPAFHSHRGRNPDRRSPCPRSSVTRPP